MTNSTDIRHRSKSHFLAALPGLQPARVMEYILGDLAVSSPAPSVGGSRILAYLRRRVVGRLKALRANAVLYATDLSMAGLSFLLASFLRVGVEDSSSALESIRALDFAAPLFVLICAGFFPLTCLYSRNWRYASVSDLLGIVRATCVATLVLLVCLFFTEALGAVPRSVPVIEFLILTPLLIAVRMRFKWAEMQPFRVQAAAVAEVAKEQVPVLLIGAGDAADHYLRALQRDDADHHLPVGILDQATVPDSYRLRGVPVLGTLADIDAVVAGLDARGLKPRHLIFTGKASDFEDRDMNALIDRAERLGIAVSRPAPALELRNQTSGSRYELRPIELTDLLERSQTALDTKALRRMIEGRRVLITGAGGSIGAELTQQVAALEPAEVVLIENCEYNLYGIDLELNEKHPGLVRTSYICDVREAARLNEIFDRHQPELVFHAAALKHVPMVELNPCEGVLTNVIGTMNVAEATRRCGARAMVQISTDKVVNTTNVMGATKRLAELYCQALDLASAGSDDPVRFMTVRFGNVLGSSGSLIPLFKRQLARGGPLTITDLEMKRFFMTIREAVELTLQASAYGLEGHLGTGEIFVLDMGEPIRIVDIARRMIKLAGFQPDRDIQIEVVGCRPGEKLFEELFDASERRVPSPVPGVLGAAPNPVPLATLQRAFAQLRLRARVGDVKGVLDLMAEVLPSYTRDVQVSPAPVPAPSVNVIVTQTPATATSKVHAAAGPCSTSPLVQVAP